MGRHSLCLTVWWSIQTTHHRQAARLPSSTNIKHSNTQSSHPARWTPSHPEPNPPIPPSTLPVEPAPPPNQFLNLLPIPQTLPPSTTTNKSSTTPPSLHRRASPHLKFLCKLALLSDLRTLPVEYVDRNDDDEGETGEDGGGVDQVAIFGTDVFVDLEGFVRACGFGGLGILEKGGRSNGRLMGREGRE